jgi:hypothetical protein
MSIRQFCQKFQMSRSSFYNLLRKGEGPDLVRPNGRQRISYEAARKWRQRHEQAASEASEHEASESEGDAAGPREAKVGMRGDRA